MTEKDRQAEVVWKDFWSGNDFSVSLNPYEEYMWSAHVYWFERFLGGIKGKNILEVGVGYGKLMSLLARKNAVCSGIDISDVAVKKAKELFKHHNLKADLRVGSAFALPYADGAFDCVYALGLIEHFDDDKDKKAIIKEMFRVVKKGGTLILTVPKRFSVYTPKRAFLKIVGKWKFGYEEEFSLKKLEGFIRADRDDGDIRFFPIDVYPPPLNFLPLTSVRNALDRRAILPLCVRLERSFPSFAIHVAHLIGAAVKVR